MIIEMESLDSVWEEIQYYGKNKYIGISEKAYRYLYDRVDQIKGPIKYEVCLTNQCNQNCIHCSNGLAYKHSNLTLESIKAILDYEPLLIVLTGGEPLLHPQFCSFVWK